MRVYTFRLLCKVMMRLERNFVGTLLFNSKTNMLLKDGFKPAVNVLKTA